MLERPSKGMLRCVLIHADDVDVLRPLLHWLVHGRLLIALPLMVDGGTHVFVSSAMTSVLSPVA